MCCTPLRTCRANTTIDRVVSYLKAASGQPANRNASSTAMLEYILSKGAHIMWAAVENMNMMLCIREDLQVRFTGCS